MIITEQIHSYRKLISSLVVLFFAVLTFSCKSAPQNENQQEIQPVTVTDSSDEQDENNEQIEEAYIEEQENNSDTENDDSEIESELRTISRKILDNGILTASELSDYFLSQHPDYDMFEILHFAQMYVVEAAVEGINSDVAFAQMCLETGFLRFGGLVQPEFHNYCGLGAMDTEHPGCIFENEQMGVRAHIQHLQAYATTEDVELNNPLIDPRYSWVHKTKFIETIDGLTGTWATDPDYGEKIERILREMEKMIN